MKKVTCPIHGFDVVLFDPGEEYLFIDDNRREAGIFVVAEGNKFLKRYIQGQCDETCPTVRLMME